MNKGYNEEKVALLFGECIEIPDPKKREAYLESACAGFPELRMEVKALLRVHEASGKFMSGCIFPGETHGDADGDSENIGLGPGDAVGPYRLMGRIGEGTTSTVFLAEQEHPVRRWVALKIIKPGMDSRKVILRFGLERQALALMDHPGVAKLLDAGATPNGRPYFVMELVSGSSITEYCDENRLSIKDRLELFIEICNAVFHAHQRGIIHRDLKPENILVSDSDGRRVMKIVDFGIAKVLHTWGLENTTKTGLGLLGTPAYMSPEQVAMNSPELDTRTDIYSLGAVLYELLCGHPPFDPEMLLGAGLEGLIHIIRVQEPQAPSEHLARLSKEEQEAIASMRGTTPLELRRMLSGDLDWITLKALEKAADDRYQAAANLTKDIRRHFEHLPVSAAAHSRRYRLSKLWQRKRRLLLAGAGVAAFFLAGVFLVAVMAIQAHRSANLARDSEKVAMLAEQQSHEAMVAMHVSTGLSDTAEERPDRAVLWFAKAAQLAGPTSPEAGVNVRRALCWMNRVPVPVGMIRLSEAMRQLTFSKDSRYLLALGGEFGWSVWDTQQQEPVSWMSEINKVRAAAWSSTDHRLALALPNGDVRVYDLSAQALVHQFHLADPVETIGFTPDMRYLVAGNDSLHVFDLLKDSAVWESAGGQHGFAGLAFSPKSRMFVGATMDDRAKVIDLDTFPRPVPDALDFPHRHVIRTESCPSKSNYREDFLEEARLSLPVVWDGGDRLVTRTGPYQLTYWDLQSGEEIKRINDICCSCKFVTDNGTGLLACGIQGGKVGIFDRWTGEPRQLLPSQGACVLDLAFGNNGQNIITAEANGLARIWSIPQGLVAQAPMHHSMDVDMVAYSEDGNLVATAQSDGLVRIWKVLEAAPDPHEMAHSVTPTYARIDGNGDHILFSSAPGWDSKVNEVSFVSMIGGEPENHSLQFPFLVETAVFNCDAKLLALGVQSPEGGTKGQVFLYNMESGRIQSLPELLPSPPTDISWNPLNGDMAVMCSAGELEVFQTGPEIKRRWNKSCTTAPIRKNPDVAYTPDGRFLIGLCPGGIIRVIDAVTGRLHFTLPDSGPDGYWAFSLSRDGRYMTTCTTEGAVLVWDLENGLRAGPVLQHPEWVYRSRFGNDPDLLVTAGHDREATVWNWRTGEIVAPPMRHPNEVYDAVFVPGSPWILTACSDGNIRVWDSGNGQLMAPPIHGGKQILNIETTPDGRIVATGNFGYENSILYLDHLLEPIPYNADDLYLIGEVVSTCTINNGSVRDLTTEEWMVRFKRLKERHPEVLRADTTLGLEKRILPRTNAMKLADHEESQCAACAKSPCSGCSSECPENPAGRKNNLLITKRDPVHTF